MVFFFFSLSSVILVYYFLLINLVLITITFEWFNNNKISTRDPDHCSGKPRRDRRTFSDRPLSSSATGVVSWRHTGTRQRLEECQSLCNLGRDFRQGRDWNIGDWVWLSHGFLILVLGRSPSHLAPGEESKRHTTIVLSPFPYFNTLSVIKLYHTTGDPIGVDEGQ